MSAEYRTYRAGRDEGLCGTCQEEMPRGTIVVWREGEGAICEGCARALATSLSAWPSAYDRAERDEYAADAREIARALGLDPEPGEWPWVEGWEDEDAEDIP